MPCFSALPFSFTVTFGFSALPVQVRSLTVTLAFVSLILAASAACSPAALTWRSASVSLFETSALTSCFWSSVSASYAARAASTAALSPVPAASGSAWMAATTASAARPSSAAFCPAACASAALASAAAFSSAAFTWLSALVSLRATSALTSAFSSSDSAL